MKFDIYYASVMRTKTSRDLVALFTLCRQCRQVIEGTADFSPTSASKPLSSSCHRNSFLTAQNEMINSDLSYTDSTRVSFKRRLICGSLLCFGRNPFGKVFDFRVSTYARRSFRWRELSPRCIRSIHSIHHTVI